LNRQPTKITTRKWRHEDIPEIIECSRAAYGDYPEEYMYTPRQYDMQFAAFPQGQFVAVCGKRVVGYATSLIVNIDDEFWYDVDELTGAGTFSTHNPDGDTLYGADIAVIRISGGTALPRCCTSGERASSKGITSGG
jgi:hypothetical protein